MKKAITNQDVVKLITDKKKLQKIVGNKKAKKEEIGVVEFIHRFDPMLTKYLGEVIGSNKVIPNLSRKALEHYITLHGTHIPEKIDFILKQFVISTLAEHLTKELKTQSK